MTITNTIDTKEYIRMRNKKFYREFLSLLLMGLVAGIAAFSVAYYHLHQQQQQPQKQNTDPAPIWALPNMETQAVSVAQTSYPNIFILYYHELNALLQDTPKPIEKAPEPDKNPFDPEKLNQALIEWVQTNSDPEKRISKSLAKLVVNTVMSEAVDQGIDPYTVFALIKVESAFNPEAESYAGAIGLTQIVPFWHKEKGATKTSVLDPKTNIQIGVRILSEYLDLHNGDLRKALLQYNGSIKIPGANYAETVFTAQNKLEKDVKKIVDRLSQTQVIPKT